MYLSSIEILGFKSFVKRTQLSFDHNITAVVGPNGCGKTNVVDAVRWALGEQKASVLRSEKMENVIFNGTKTKKPLSMAEVSLTIQNNKKILPSEYTEVKLTRRLYRNGESEYFLNQSPCRLKDFHSLFSNTGMGSDAYSVIELKMIDKMLSENVQERQKLFEEAAGISMYKQRRKQAIKKIEETADDLDRIRDIKIEVEKKVELLKHQSAQAKRASSLKEEMMALEIKVASIVLNKLVQSIGPLEERISEKETEKKQLDVDINKLEIEVARSRNDLEGSEKTRLSLQKKHLAISEELNATEKQILSAEQKKQRYHEQLHEKNQAIVRLDKRETELDIIIKDVSKELDTASALFSSEKNRSNEHTLDYEKKDKALKEKKQELRELLEKRLSITKNISFLEASIESMTSAQKSTKEELSLLQEKVEIDKKNYALKVADIEKRSIEHKKALGNIENKEKTLKVAKSRKTELALKGEAIKESLLTLRSKENHLKNKIAFLQSLLETYEGLPEGIQVLESANLHLGIGCLGDLIYPDKTYRLAVEAALEEVAKYYVTETEQQATQAIGYLQTKNKGKITFIILERLSNGLYKPRASSIWMKIPKMLFFKEPSSSIKAKPLLSTLKADSKIMPILEALLRNTYIVNTLDEAMSLQEKHPDIDVVTMQGDRCAGKGIIYAGGTSSSENTRIFKRGELEDSFKELELLEEKLMSEKKILQDNEYQLSLIDLDDKESSLKNANNIATNLEKTLTQTTYEKEIFTQDIERTRHKVNRLEEELSNNELKIEESKEKKITLEDKIQAISKTSKEAQHVVENAEIELEATRASLQEVTLGLKEKEFYLEKLNSKKILASDEKQLNKKNLNVIKNELEESKDVQESLESELKTLKEKIIPKAQEKESVIKELQNIESVYAELKSMTSKKESLFKEKQRSREVVNQILSELKQEKLGLSFKKDAVTKKLVDTYAIDFPIESILNTTYKKEEENAIPSLEKKIAELNRQIKAIGSVNELALEEFQEEKDRLDFLISQHKDLLDAEAKLADAIEEINKTAIEKFTLVFEDIRKNFISLFRDLFSPEDSADIILSKKDDPLESDIDIIAKPRGKRPQSINLLSGGEKTLTAVALLFAIYLVKPSPFCILDEVDAPLDDENINRFINLLGKFAGNTQFIIITHNKRTMEAAGILYGVTMEEQGVSKLISVELKESKKLLIEE